jgi:hypothetical protein
MGNWAHDLYQMPLEQPEQWASFQYTTIDGGNVKQEEIDAARRDLDERTFRQEFMATFETYSGRVYYSFDRKQNCQPPEKIDLSILYTGWDFNVSPMSVVIAVKQGDTLYVIDEIRMYSSNTQEAVEELLARYPKSKIWSFPDPAARQRKTSAGGATDITILQNAGLIVKAPHSHTPIRDRVNAVNSRLCDSTGIRHLFIHPRCKYTIEGLERQTYKEGTVQPDKDNDYNHMLDALGYMVDYLFPIRKDTSHIPQPTTWGHQVQGTSPTMNYNLRNNYARK